jgi:hypothetical protein
MHTFQTLREPGLQTFEEVEGLLLKISCSIACELLNRYSAENL